MGTKIKYNVTDFKNAIKYCQDAYNELTSIKEPDGEISIQMKYVLKCYMDVLGTICNNILMQKDAISNIYNALENVDGNTQTSGMAETERQKALALAEENRRRKRVEQQQKHGSGIAETERQKALALAEENRRRKQQSKGNNNTSSSYSTNTQSVTNSAPSNLATGIIGLPSMVITPNENEVKTRIQPTVDVRTESYQKLGNLLKNGTITSETTALYDTLKTLGMGDEADSLLKKYGYEASKDANGNTIISKIKSGSTENDSTKVPSGSNTDKKNNDSDGEVVAPEAKPSDNNKKENSNKTSYTTVTRKEYASSNRKYTSGDGSTTQVTDSTPNTTDKNTSIIDNSGKELPKHNKPNGKVITIDDDVPNVTKKSNGIGAAIPIGLGAIAAGAAATAGVRYVKKRHDNQEEYDEEYDDENNALDDNNNQYVDSAEYNSGDDYTSDDYLGPAGSTYTDVNANDTEDNYVDPEELETDSDDSDFSNDKVLEQLNFDGQ